MNGICKILDCYFGAMQDDDLWVAVKVYRDGNRIDIGGPFDTEEEAEACAAEVHDQELQDNSQFGVGA
jgi:hypothetical protein